MKNALLVLVLVVLSPGWSSFVHAQDNQPAQEGTTVKAANPDGFIIQTIRSIGLAPNEAYEAFISGFSEWYDASHSYSSKAENLSLDLNKHCMLERLPNGGFVRHMEIVFHQPGKMLRMSGGLGPLQGMGVSGAMTFTFTESNGGTELKMDYFVSGSNHLNLDKIAGPVDNVLGAQLDRFQEYCQSLKSKDAKAQVDSTSEKDDVAELKVQLQTQLDRWVADENFPGATLAIVLKDGTSLDLASGMADPDSETKMPVGARMLCGSTGKTFVSALALQLVAEGKLNLDSLASTYLDGEPTTEWFNKLPNADKMTIRSLMNHTSGLPRYLFQEDYLEDLKSDPMKERTPREGLMALRGTTPIHPVGEGWAYSDSNYLVLGLIIEAVTGRDFYELANERLLNPLKLTSTTPSIDPKMAGLVQGHIGSVNLFDLPVKTVVDGRYVMHPKFEWCGGGFVTNTRDLARWLFALHSGEVLSKSMHDQLVMAVDFKTGQPVETGKGGYGLGSYVWPTNDGLFYGHAGIMPGYLTQIEYSADYGFSIALQTNTDEGLGRKFHQTVQDFAAIVIDHQ